MFKEKIFYTTKIGMNTTDIEEGKVEEVDNFLFPSLLVFLFIVAIIKLCFK